MDVCKACGQQIPSPEVTDDDIIRAIENQHAGMIYAAGRPDGSADRSQWFVTRGYPKGPFSRQRVDRMVRSGQLVPYSPGSDAAYTTPKEAARLREKMAERELRTRRA